MVITSATPGRTLDIETRQRRYFITMGIRVACFVAMIFVPGVWRWVCLAGAAFLPAIAVLLANNVDHRPMPTPPDDEAEEHRALPSAPIIPGEVG